MAYGNFMLAILFEEKKCQILNPIPFWLSSVRALFRMSVRKISNCNRKRLKYKNLKRLAGSAFGDRQIAHSARDFETV